MSKKADRKSSAPPPLNAADITDVKFFIPAIIPGLFQGPANESTAASHKIIFIPDVIDRFQFHTESSPPFEPSAVRLSSDRFEIDDHCFVPIVADNFLLGGLVCDATETDEAVIGRIKREPGMMDMLRSINHRLLTARGRDDVAAHIMQMVSRQRSFDSFMRDLASWITEFMDGGVAGLYYGSGECFTLRKLVGDISLFDEIPVAIEGKRAVEFNRHLREGRLLIVNGRLPDYASELYPPPLPRFILGGELFDELEFRLTGLLPDLASVEHLVFFEKLKSLLAVLGRRHFSTTPDWPALMRPIASLISDENSRQEMMESLFSQINEYVFAGFAALALDIRDNGRLETIATVSKAESSHYTDLAEKISADEALWSRLAEAGYVIIDHATDPETPVLAELLHDEDIDALAIIAVRGGTGIRGLIVIGTPLPAQYLRKNIHIFVTIAFHVRHFLTMDDNRRVLETCHNYVDRRRRSFSQGQGISTIRQDVKNLTHAINNYIGAIVGRSELVATRLNMIEDKHAKLIKAVEDSRRICRAASEMEQMVARIDDLMAPSEANSGTAIDIAELIHEAARIIKSKYVGTDFRIAAAAPSGDDRAFRTTPIVNEIEVLDCLIYLLAESVLAAGPEATIEVSCNYREDGLRIVISTRVGHSQYRLSLDSPEWVNAEKIVAAWGGHLHCDRQHEGIFLITIAFPEKAGGAEISPEADHEDSSAAVSPG